MLVSAAVCPHPPVLVPEMAGEAAPELDAVRAACEEAVRRLRDGDALVVVGGGPETRSYGPDAYATLQPYGLAWASPEEPHEGAEALPLSLTIGRWLLQRQDNVPAMDAARFEAIAFDASPEECLALGRELAATADRVALLVMGDGSACRSEQAPGYFDDRARPHDEAVARALGDADTAALAALDPKTSWEIRAAGRAAWQVLAGAARGDAGRARFTAELLADEAPYGVGYLVAAWSVTGQSW
ncbi:hypothetical protein BZB76_3394 [Actinomadura pelletieri DSM 43383]|uniref:Catalytic LigB subunit of aromatic ring-opening dioxygenase n=1 Tax=Actinomadura pelletieri DSM 43383 TaxID=1120940 RepID=A0A495QPR6_9ACTN|nr:class III extradiol dioxygenase subunit B-like domain-containing protein [Actinomadura pelletieri]RKS74872.1 hypothetical protein BZB76_3394 [Actinomadura pelletieri DSM 43383]